MATRKEWNREGNMQTRQKTKFQEGDLIKHIKDPYAESHEVLEVRIEKHQVFSARGPEIQKSVIYVIRSDRTQEVMLLQDAKPIINGWQKI